MEPSDLTILIPGAGGGQRLGGVPKALLGAAGGTLVEMAVERFAPFSDRLLVAVQADDVPAVQHLVGRSAEVVAGGATRQETVARLLDEADRPFVMIHDVARPFVDDELIKRVLAAAAEYGAAAPCVPVAVRDSIGLRDGDQLAEMLDRSRVVGTQTPYAMRADWLVEAHRRADVEGWDATSTLTLIRRAGHPVRLVDGAEDNIKITYRADLERLNRRSRRADPGGSGAPP